MTKAEAERFEKVWLEAKESNSMDKLWYAVYDCAKFSVLKYCKSKSLSLRDFDDKVMDITIKCLEDMKRKGWYPDSLASFVYYRMLAVLINKKQQYEDKIIYDSEQLVDKEGWYYDEHDLPD